MCVCVCLPLSFLFTLCDTSHPKIDISSCKGLCFCLWYYTVKMSSCFRLKMVEGTIWRNLAAFNLVICAWSVGFTHDVFRTPFSMLMVLKAILVYLFILHTIASNSRCDRKPFILVGCAPASVISWWCSWLKNWEDFRQFLHNPISSSPTILPLAAPSYVSCVFFDIVSIVLLDSSWHCLFFCIVQMMRSEEVFAVLGGGGLGLTFFLSRPTTFYIQRQTRPGI